MKVTFPHLGPLQIALSQLFSYLEIPHVSPPPNGPDALKKGAAISPEEICLPFKYMVGNLIEAYDLGADTAVMIATAGPCRLGEYGELFKNVLDNGGYHYEWILIDSPSTSSIRKIKASIDRLISVSDAGTIKKIRGVIKAISLIRNMDSLRSRIREKAGYLKNPNEAVKLLNKIEIDLQRAGSFDECFSSIKQAESMLADFACKNGHKPVKVLVVGEIYTSIEPKANGDLEERLMSMGCSVRRHIDISWWIRYTMFSSVIPEKICGIFLPGKGIKHNVGGYGRETVARILRDKWCDGVIKIMPAGCMPEIVAKAHCEAMQDEEDMRILHLVYDEMSGQAGYETRIEAFVDMLERRKDVLAGDRYRVHKYGPDFDGR